MARRSLLMLSHCTTTMSLSFASGLGSWHSITESLVAGSDLPKSPAIVQQRDDCRNSSQIEVLVQLELCPRPRCYINVPCDVLENLRVVNQKSLTKSSNDPREVMGSLKKTTTSVLTIQRWRWEEVVVIDQEYVERAPHQACIARSQSSVP